MHSTLLDSFVLELVLHSVSVRLGKVGCSLGRLLKNYARLGV